MVGGAGEGSGRRADPQEPELETANVARMYDYFLGGAHNFAVDRALACQVASQLPHVGAWARANRRFLLRAVRFCLEAGVTQFLDLGSGLPTMGSVHEVAHRQNPAARVAYVDAEPVAVAHGRELLDGVDGVTVTQADIRDVEAVLGAPTVTAVLDFTEPVAVLMMAVLHFVSDADDPRQVVAGYLAALAPGSFLALSHVSADYDDPTLAAQMRGAEVVYEHAATPGYLRDRSQLHQLLGGLALVEPGLVDVNQWRSDDADAEPLGAYGAVALVP